MVQMIPLFGPVPGGMEMMVILLIAVLLFGANKIPKLARSTGSNPVTPARLHFVQPRGRDDPRKQTAFARSRHARTATCGSEPARRIRTLQVAAPDAQRSEHPGTSCAGSTGGAGRVPRGLTSSGSQHGHGVLGVRVVSYRPPRPHLGVRVVALGVTHRWTGLLVALT